MAQATRTPGPGTTIEDALAAELQAVGNVSGDVTGSWVQVDRPAHVAVVATLGTIASGVTGVDIEVQGADDNSGTNTVSYGRFDTIGASDDDTTRYLEAVVHKSYMRVVIDHSGTGNASVGVKVHGIPHKGRSNTRTA